MKLPFIARISVPLLAASASMSLTAVASEGLYSADELMDADVHDSNGEEIGEVEDILLDNDMKIHGLVIKTGDILGMGGRKVVAERGTFTVRAEDDSDGDEFEDIDYEVHMDATKEALKSFPEYDKNWWDKTRETLSQAWEKTKRGSESAWESTKEASASAWEKTKESAEKMGKKVEKKMDDL